MDVSPSLTPYRSPKRKAALSIIALSVLTAINLLAVVVYPLEALFGGFNAIINAVTILKPMVFLATIFLFLIWVNRASRNLTPLKAAHINYSPGWSVGWWFVPFANLIKPYQAIKEIWIQSAPDFDPEANFVSRDSVIPPFFKFWWTLWLASIFWTNLAHRLVPIAGSYFFYLIIWAFGAALFSIAGILAVRIIRETTNRQEERFQRISNLEQDSQISLPSATINQEVSN